MRSRAELHSRGAFVVAAFAVLCAVPATSLLAQAYILQDIGKLPDSHVTVAFSLNNAGEAVGWGQGPGSLVRPFRFSPETGIVELPLPPGFTWGYATDISNNGIVVGTAYNGISANEARAWRMVNGVIELLPPFPSTCPGMIPSAVNDNGEVVGRTCPDGGGPTNPWYFSAKTGLLDLLPIGLATAVDINNARVVTGQASSRPAYRWTAPNGPLELLPLLPPPHDSGATGIAINEAGQVTGYGIRALSGPDHWRAFVANDDAEPPTLLTDYPGPARTGGYGINECGDVVGNSGTTSTPDGTAWIWTRTGGRVNLIELVDVPGVYGIRSGQDINDQGQILAKATTDQPYGSAVILTPLSRRPGLDQRLPCSAGVPAPEE